MTEAERLTKIEERYVHLQQHMAEQDKAMHELSDAVSRLKKEILLLRSQVVTGTGEPGDVADERPPHY
jgi:uncharacterized coiled-coil protein SlyX